MEQSNIGNESQLQESGRVDPATSATNSFTTTHSSEDQLCDQMKEVVNMIRKPIFIATAEGHIVQSIERFLFVEGYQDKEHSEMPSGPILKKEEYVLLVTNAEIYQGLRQQYLFSLLKEDEQARAQQVAINKELHQKAFTHALQIDTFIRDWSENRSYLGGGGSLTFNEKELRVILNKMKHLTGKSKGRLTHQDAWNIMDLLLLQGFIGLENPLEEIHNREKRRYRLIISDEDRMKYLKTQRDQSLYLMLKYEDQEKGLRDQIHELKLKIENKNVESQNQFRTESKS